MRLDEGTSAVPPIASIAAIIRRVAKCQFQTLPHQDVSEPGGLAAVRIKPSTNWVRIGALVVAIRPVVGLPRPDDGQFQNARLFCGLHQPAASRIRFAIVSGCDISETWLALTSIVLAPIRFAMKRSRSGLMVRSSVDMAYHLGFERHAA
jgi:hypothetical protein